MTTELNEYNQKRDFEKSKEPKGQLASQEGFNFVVQHHIARRDHYDFRLEWRGSMLSWAIPKGPSYNPTEKRLSIKVENHPLDYRNFEGIIPKGEYGGGVVMIWDEGTWQPYGDVDKALENGVIKFDLKGQRLKGKWALIRIDKNENKNWLLLKEKDSYALDESGISKYITSVRTGRTMEEIEKNQAIKNELPFNKTKVQLAKIVNSVPQYGDWVFEPKYDGYRILAYVQGEKTRLISRNNKDFTNKFVAIKDALSDFAKGRSMVLDGEMAVIDETGKTDFQSLQNYIKNKGKNKLTYVVFDLLALDGEDLRERKLIERKQKLELILKDATKNLYYSSHIEGKGEECFYAACQTGFEGIIGKKPNSLYSGNRNGDWIKIKCDNRQEFVVGGYTLSNKKTNGLSSILLGYYEKGKLVFAGRAGTGFNQKDIKEIKTRFEPIKRTESPFINPPKKKTGEEIFWVEPKIVAEIKFAEWTKENLLRQASFKGLREDKNPQEVIKEQKEELKAQDKLEDKEQNMEKEKPIMEEKEVLEEVKITSPDKVIYNNPQITKKQVVEYYLKVAKRMLPYMKNRLLSVVRCPKGAFEPCFFKKHPNSGGKGIETMSISQKEEDKDYFYIKDMLGLINEAQMGTLEFHIWASSVMQLENPDMMVFDLDPDENMDLDTVRQGVNDLKSILQELNLKSYLKTSGGKGYHVVLPFKPKADWNTFYNFSKHVAEVMESKWPKRYTKNVRKANRKNKIFIDWMRNGRGATSIAPYSLRAREKASVSMPIKWEELYSVAPNDIDMFEALKRIENDPWQGYFNVNQELK